MEKSKAFVSTGIGAAIIGEGVEVLPLEAKYQQRLPQSVVGQKLNSQQAKPQATVSKQTPTSSQQVKKPTGSNQQTQPGKPQGNTQQ